MYKLYVEQTVGDPGFNVLDVCFLHRGLIVFEYSLFLNDNI